MPDDRKPGFFYMKSESLNQEIAISQKTGKIYTQDKVVYEKKEVDLLKQAKVTIPLEVHLLKKMCDGEIVQITNAE